MRGAEKLAGAAIVAQQRAWAMGYGLSPYERGYLPSYAVNLRAPLSAAALNAFEDGAGGELTDSEHPAKMRALHSSSALAVNVFDFWSGRDASPLLQALRVCGRAGALCFEKQLSTGARGIPPHIDVIISTDDGRLVGIESKFTEWMTPKTDMASAFQPYLRGDRSYWSCARLPSAHALVAAIVVGTERFSYLNVPQLLKHALGLARASAEGWELRYLFFDAPGPARKPHSEELARFEAAVGRELRFRGMSYQEFVSAIPHVEDDVEARYFSYLHERYFPPTARQSRSPALAAVVRG